MITTLNFDDLATQLTKAPSHHQRTIEAMIFAKRSIFQNRLVQSEIEVALSKKDEIAKTLWRQNKSIKSREEEKQMVIKTISFHRINKSNLLEQCLAKIPTLEDSMVAYRRLSDEADAEIDELDARVETLEDLVTQDEGSRNAMNKSLAKLEKQIDSLQFRNPTKEEGSTDDDMYPLLLLMKATVLKTNQSKFPLVEGESSAFYTEEDFSEYQTECRRLYSSRNTSKNPMVLNMESTSSAESNYLLAVDMSKKLNSTAFRGGILTSLKGDPPASLEEATTGVVLEQVLASQQLQIANNLKASYGVGDKTFRDLIDNMGKGIAANVEINNQQAQPPPAGYFSKLIEEVRYVNLIARCGLDPVRWMEGFEIGASDSLERILASWEANGFAPLQRVNLMHVFDSGMIVSSSLPSFDTAFSTEYTKMLDKHKVAVNEDEDEDPGDTES